MRPSARHVRPAPRYSVGVGVALLTLLAAGCADLATAPGVPGAGVPARPSLEVVSPSVVAAGLRRSSPLPQTVAGVLTVGPSGGTFAFRGTGLTIHVPRGAVTRALTISVTAYAGDMVAYDFQPHGTVFARPLVLRQAVGTTTYAGLADRSGVEAGYFADARQLDVANGRATVDEFLPVSVDAAGSALTFSVEHFSGYMLSSGRR
jgi:hypothetical protein